MKTIEESVITAMDGGDKAILPYLPYLLQDFWEMGSNPEVMISLIKQHIAPDNNLRVLDLGCGKGAVSVHAARQIRCACYGIDAIPEFIAYAASKAAEYGVGNWCKFEVGDIREKIKTLGKYNVIILGAIGQVFGNYFETLTTLKNHLGEGGIILIDDGYVEDQSRYKQEHVFRKSELTKQIADAGMQLIDEVVANEDAGAAANYDKEYSHLLKRCRELSDKYPEKAELFLNYSNRQKNEYANLKNEITCSTMVVKRKE